MPECQSWKVGDSPHDELHQPGECSVCWVECHNEVEDPRYKRCRSCYEALASSPVGWVRRLLINEEDPPDYVVAALVDDGNFAVAGTARWHAARRPSLSPHHRMASSPEPPPRPDVAASSDGYGSEYADDDDDDDGVGQW